MQIVDQFFLPLNTLSGVYEYLGAIFNIRSIVKKNKQLQYELSKLQFKLSDIQEVKLENQKLRKFLALKERISYEVVPAEIIAKIAEDFTRIVVLNKGYKSGIRTNAGVIAHGGLVGKVLEVGDRTSKVILINDANFKIVAKVKHSQETGMVIGGVKENTCYMKYLSQDSNAKIGDVVVTSENNEFIPPGIPVGRIRNFTSSSERFFKQAVLDTYVNLKELKFVLYIKQK